MNPIKTKRPYLLLLVVLLLLAGCRNETQNRIRRDLQDYTGGRQYITLYSISGSVIFTGAVDGQVSRSVSDINGGAATELASYIYWYNPAGKYYQTDMPYLLTSQAPEGAAN